MAEKKTDHTTSDEDFWKIIKESLKKPVKKKESYLTPDAAKIVTENVKTNLKKEKEKKQKR